VKIFLQKYSRRIRSRWELVEKWKISMNLVVCKGRMLKWPRVQSCELVAKWNMRCEMQGNVWEGSSLSQKSYLYIIPPSDLCILSKILEIDPSNKSKANGQDILGDTAWMRERQNWHEAGHSGMHSRVNLTTLI